MENYFIIGFILFLAAFTQGLTGFGFALVSIPLLSLLMDIKTAIPLGALCGLIINIYLTIRLRKHVKFSEVKFLILGAFVGIPIGAFYLKVADPYYVKLFLGIVVLLFVFSTSLNVIKHFKMHKYWGTLFGLFSGLLGGAFNANGPPILIYLQLINLDKNKHKASFAAFFVVASIIIVLDHAITGISSSAIFFTFLKQLPSVILGLLLGDFLFQKISTKIFHKIVIVALFIIGILLIVKH